LEGQILVGEKKKGVFRSRKKKRSRGQSVVNHFARKATPIYGAGHRDRLEEKRNQKKRGVGLRAIGKSGSLRLQENLG